MLNVIEQIQAAEAAKLRALAGLHKELGFGSAQELASAILGAAGAGARAAAAVAAAREPKPNGAAPAKKSGKGRRIDDETKRQVVAGLKAGQAGARLAKQFGVSYPTIQNWKTALGLVKARSGARKSNSK